jgi:hypothetical protein
MLDAIENSQQMLTDLFGSCIYQVSGTTNSQKGEFEMNFSAFENENLAIKKVKEAAECFGYAGVAQFLGCSRQAVYLWASGQRTVPAFVYIGILQQMGDFKQVKFFQGRKK